MTREFEAALYELLEAGKRLQRAYDSGNDYEGEALGLCGAVHLCRLALGGEVWRPVFYARAALGKNAKTVSPPDPAEGTPFGKPATLTHLCHPATMATQERQACRALGPDGLCQFRNCSRAGLTPWPTA
jgi:hypothetical protein